MKIDKIVIKTIFVVLRIVVVAVIAMLIYKGAVLAYDYGYRVFAEEPVDVAPGLDMVVVIEESMGPKEIGDLLESKGLIKDGTLSSLAKKYEVHLVVQGEVDEVVKLIDQAENPTFHRWSWSDCKSGRLIAQTIYRLLSPLRREFFHFIKFLLLSI